VEIFTQFSILDLGWLLFKKKFGNKAICILDIFLFICEKLKIILQMFSNGFTPHQNWIDIIVHLYHIIIQ